MATPPLFYDAVSSKRARACKRPEPSYNLYSGAKRFFRDA